MYKTLLEPEEKCNDYGQFRRKFIAYYNDTNDLVKGFCDIPDTFFSIPAVTKTEHGFLTFRDDAELHFIPNKNQTQSIKEFKRELKKSYK